MPQGKPYTTYSMEGKKAAAARAVEMITDGMTVGLGSGSTSTLAIHALGERVRNGLTVTTVASSRKSEELARGLSIPVLDPSEVEIIDIAIDGADEVDKKGNLIKGGGGSLLREKIIAYASRRFHVMVDDSKLVDELGKFALPVEVTPFAVEHTLRHLKALQCDPVLRKSGDHPYVTDNGNYIADCRFKSIGDPAWLDVKLKMIPGVVESGLFSSKIITSIFVGKPDGDVHEIAINP